MANLIHNERTKLMATFLNNLGVAIVGGGVFIPVFASAGLAQNYPFLISVLGIVTGGGLMGWGVYSLKDLKE